MVEEKVEVVVHQRIGKRGQRAWHCVGAATSLLGMATCLSAQQFVPVKGPVTLRELPPVEKGVAAFPRLVAGPAVSVAIAAKINASLQRLDNAVSGAAQDCREQFQESKGTRSTDAWTRTIRVTMKGPMFYSVEAADLQYCGGAYPNADTLPMVYDLATGKPLDWLTVLPTDASATTDSALDGTTVGLVTWDKLNVLALKAASKECREVLKEQESMRFLLSLDGRAGGLIVRVFGLPHVIAACEEPFTIPAAQTKQMGVATRMTEVLEAAAAQQH